MSEMSEKSNYDHNQLICDTFEDEITLENMPFAYTLKAMNTSTIMLHSAYKMRYNEWHDPAGYDVDKINSLTADVQTAISELSESYHFLVDSLVQEVRYELTSLEDAATSLRVLYSAFEIDNAKFMHEEMSTPYLQAPTAEELQERFMRQLQELVTAKEPEVASSAVASEYAQHLHEAFDRT